MNVEEIVILSEKTPILGLYILFSFPNFADVKSTIDYNENG
jgi:hypothetical protein